MFAKLRIVLLSLDIALQQPKVATNLNPLRKSLKKDVQQHPCFSVFSRHSFVSTWLHCITFGKATSTENYNQLLYIPYTILYMKNLCWVPFWRCVFSRLHGCLDWPGVQLWHQPKLVVAAVSRWLIPTETWCQPRAWTTRRSASKTVSFESTDRAKGSKDSIM